MKEKSEINAFLSENAGVLAELKHQFRYPPQWGQFEMEFLDALRSVSSAVSPLTLGLVEDGDGVCLQQVHRHPRVTDTLEWLGDRGPGAGFISEAARLLSPQDFEVLCNQINDNLSGRRLRVERTSYGATFDVFDPNSIGRSGEQRRQPTAPAPAPARAISTHSRTPCERAPNVLRDTVRFPEADRTRRITYADGVPTLGSMAPDVLEAHLTNFKAWHSDADYQSVCVKRFGDGAFRVNRLQAAYRDSVFGAVLGTPGNTRYRSIDLIPVNNGDQLLVRIPLIADYPPTDSFARAADPAMTLTLLVTNHSAGSDAIRKLLSSNREDLIRLLAQRQILAANDPATNRLIEDYADALPQFMVRDFDARAICKDGVWTKYEDDQTMIADLKAKEIGFSLNGNAPVNATPFILSEYKDIDPDARFALIRRPVTRLFLARIWGSDLSLSLSHSRT